MLQGKSLEHLKIGLTYIVLATENFDEKYCIGSGGYGKVYKAQLEHFDSNNWSSIEGVDKCDLPKRRSMVAIKHIFNTQGEQGFNVEIETLSSCKHDNIISLLGFCDEGPDHRILIYELASRGNLENYMESDDKMTNLRWVQCVKICLNTAHGLKYIHTNTDQDKKKIIHRDIKSANILLGENWEGKIADFGLSKIHLADQEASTIDASTIACTPMYFDPEYKKYARLNKKSDIYSFGVVLFEILTGRLAYDRIYTKIKEADGHVFSLSKGANKDSLDIFSEIAYGCLVETQAQRPTIDDVHELKKALRAQERSQKENFKMSLEDIKSATQNFSVNNTIGRGGSGNVNKGVASHANGHTIIAAKRLDRRLFGHGETGFFRELDIPLKYKHENVIGLVGFCDDEIEKIILHDFASRGRLDWYLSDPSLTWVMRLKICIDIASGLNFLHASDVNQEVVTSAVFEGVVGNFTQQAI
nr:protein kinase-like domain, phloem protein 2-like protein [Tanacetum cinerariifolium]